MGKLVLVRHGKSDYNEKGLWAGWDDAVLTEEGKNEAKTAAESLKDIRFDSSFTSVLSRAKDTLSIIKTKLNQTELPVTENQALNERNYGNFTKKNKWQVKEQLGEAEFLKLRRSWDYPIPNGESLKQVYERVVPYYRAEIEPKLKARQNVLVSSSGNALRALVKYLEHIPDDKISDLEIATGEVYVYTVDRKGTVVTKEKRASRPNTV